MHVNIYSDELAGDFKATLKNPVKYAKTNREKFFELSVDFARGSSVAFFASDLDHLSKLFDELMLLVEKEKRMRPVPESRVL